MAMLDPMEDWRGHVNEVQLYHMAQYGGLEGIQLGLALPHGHARSIGGLEGM